jgi:hypothetical protein
MAAERSFDIPMFSRARIERGAHPVADVVLDARSVETLLLRSLADHGQDVVAERAGISPTRLSRWKNAASDGGGLQLPEVAAVLGAMDLTIVDCRPSDMVTVPSAYLDALILLARRALES